MGQTFTVEKYFGPWSEAIEICQSRSHQQVEKCSYHWGQTRRWNSKHPHEDAKKLHLISGKSPHHQHPRRSSWRHTQYQNNWERTRRKWEISERIIDTQCHTWQRQQPEAIARKPKWNDQAIEPARESWNPGDESSFTDGSAAARELIPAHWVKEAAELRASLPSGHL